MHSAGSLPGCHLPLCATGTVPPVPRAMQRGAASSLLHRYSDCLSPGPPRSHRDCLDLHGSRCTTLQSLMGLWSAQKPQFFFSKTPKNPPIPGAFPTSCAASHLHTKKPGQLGSPRQIRHRKISWALSCHVSSCPNHNKKPHKQWSKLQ